MIDLTAESLLTLDPPGNRTTNRQREKSWHLEQQALALESLESHGTLALQEAARERPRTYVKATGLCQFRPQGAASSQRRRPNLLTPNASDLYSRTERVVKDYVNRFKREPEAFKQCLGRPDFLKREAQSILVDEGHGYKVWNKDNQCHLAEPKLCWEDQNHKLTILWNVRCWIASRINENLGSPQASLVEPAGSTVTSDDAPSAEQNRWELSGSPEPELGVPVHQPRIRNALVSPPSTSIEEPCRRNVSKRRRSDSSRQSLDTRGRSVRSRNGSYERSFSVSPGVPYERGHPSQGSEEQAPIPRSTKPTEFLRDVQVPRKTLNENAVFACAFSDPDCERQCRENLGSNIKSLLVSQQPYSYVLQRIYPLVARLSEECDLNNRTHPLYEYWKQIRKSITAWHDIIARVEGFRTAREYSHRSPSKWATHLAAQGSSEAHILLEIRFHELLKWGERQGIITPAFLRSWNPDLAIVIYALLGVEFMPFEYFEALAIMLERYNQDLLNWFRERPIFQEQAYYVDEDSGAHQRGNGDQEQVEERERPERLFPERSERTASPSGFMNQASFAG